MSRRLAQAPVLRLSFPSLDSRPQRKKCHRNIVPRLLPSIVLVYLAPLSASIWPTKGSEYQEVYGDV